MNFRVACLCILFFLTCQLGAAANVPSSARSRGVVGKVGPRVSKEMEAKGLMLGAPIFIRIFKQPGTLELWVKNGNRFDLFRTYPVCKFSGDIGPKLKEGDGQAPEGVYLVTPHAMNPNSSYHLSFNLGYPNKFDRFHGRTGSALMVHGRCVSIGCYAMGDPAIEEIWTVASQALAEGQRYFQVECYPFVMTSANLEKQRKNRWYSFWSDLKPIYDAFEKTRVPSEVKVVKGRYQLGAKDK